MSNMDDLRRLARQQDEDELDKQQVVLSRRQRDDKLFGMSAVERMFLAIGLFGVSVVVSVVLLLLTESIAF